MQHEGAEISKAVIIYGTFDLFHIGHLPLTRRLQTHVNRVIVGAPTNEFNSGKGKRCIMPHEQCAEIVSSIKGGDLIIPKAPRKQKEKDIREHKIDVFTIGDDWQGKFDYLSAFCKVAYLPRTEGVPTSALKEIAPGFDQTKVHQLRGANELVQLIAEELR